MVGLGMYKTIYTEKEAQKLFNRLKESGYVWRTGADLVNSNSSRSFFKCLPCDLFIHTYNKTLSYDSSLINGENKIFSY